MIELRGVSKNEHFSSLNFGRKKRILEGESSMMISVRRHTRRVKAYMENDGKEEKYSQQQRNHRENFHERSKVPSILEFSLCKIRPTDFESDSIFMLLLLLASKGY
ncbi:uncharacterized protein [Primulina eburnea]|uniref:uncharacterized protein n=1 Tax=Primulina eburnea TaxID=1245227 RepID=UPI003C6C0548